MRPACPELKGKTLSEKKKIERKKLTQVNSILHEQADLAIFKTISKMLSIIKDAHIKLCSICKVERGSLHVKGGAQWYTCVSLIPSTEPIKQIKLKS